MSQRVYKLVEKRGDGVLRSVYALGKYTTEYQPGVRMEKKNLFVFLDENDAVSHCDLDMGEQVWECETETNPRECPPEIPDYDHTGDDTYCGITPKAASGLIGLFWIAPYRATELRMLKRMYGSYLVDDVKLIRRVY